MKLIEYYEKGLDLKINFEVINNNVLMPAKWTKY
jgi:hypothetical protein